MAKFKAVQNITVRFDAPDDTADKFYKYLCDEYKSVEWDFDGDTIFGVEKADGFYYPGCMYTKNGDGWPEEYETEFECFDEDLTRTCNKFEEDNDDFAFQSCTCEDVSDIREEYYDENYFEEDF